MKICSICNEKKNKNLFPTKGAQCKCCLSLKQKKYREENKNKLKSYFKDRYDKNREELLKQKKNYRIDNPDKVAAINKKYYIKNKEKISKNQKEYRLSNRVKLTQINNIYLSKRRKTDEKYNLRRTISSSVYSYLKNNNKHKNGSIIKHLPYTIEELKQHLESQFEPWMTWENWGTYRVDSWNDNDKFTWTWQIDHIIPHSKFNYTSMKDKEFRKCWALDNLRPYSAKQNVIKGASR